MYYPDEPQQGTTQQRNSLKLTKSGINHVVLSKNNPVRGRILPSFDFSLNPKDESFPTSHSPYRDMARVSDQGIPLFRSWFFYFPMHTYLGKSKHFYVSPRVRADFNASVADVDKFDPVDEMFWKIRRNDTNYMHLRYLVMKPQNTTEVVNLPLATNKKCAVMNFFGTNDGKNPDYNFLLVMSDMGMTMTKDLLDSAGLRSQAPRDINWQDFLFGDVTDPFTGLEAHATTKVPTGNAERGIPVNTLAFSDNDKALTGSKVVPVTPQILAGRSNFFDIENVWNIPSAQSIVDHLVDDNEIPLEFMKEICGKYCDFPDRAPISYDSQSTSLPSAGTPVLPPPMAQQATQPPQQAYTPPVTTQAPQQAPQGPPAASGETDKEFAERVDAELAALRATDPNINFVSYLKDDTKVLRYLAGKK